MVRQRPSRHGAILGETLSALAVAGQACGPELPPMCATCAFKPGCLTNQMAATLLEAFNCVLGIDKALFCCHHGMVDGEPTRACAGALMAQRAPWVATKEAILQLNDRLAAMSGPDEVRIEFDLWLSEVDPDGELDDYELGRLQLRRPPPHGRKGT